jgi:hypothetical protein
MACCRCCCGGEDCEDGQQGKCCCGGSEGECCTEEQYCCDGECQEEPCDCDCDGYDYCEVTSDFTDLSNQYLVGCLSETVDGPCNFIDQITLEDTGNPIPYDKYVSFADAYDPADPTPFVPDEWQWADGYPDALDTGCRYFWIQSVVISEEPCSGGDAECPQRCSYSNSTTRLWKVANCVAGVFQDITGLASATGQGVDESSAVAVGFGSGTCECDDPPEGGGPACEPEEVICYAFP